MKIGAYKISDFYKKWCEFWFAPQDLLTISMVRFFVFTLMFILYIERQINIETYYFDGGFVPLRHVQDLAFSYFKDRIWYYPASDTWSFYLHLSFLGLLLLIALGVGGRKITWAALLLHVSFLQRNLAINYGVDLYNTFWLFYFSFIQSDQQLSILNKFRKVTPIVYSDMLTSMGIRLMQIQLVVAYVYAGIEKLKGGTWWSGVALWQVMANQQITPYDFGFLKYFPLVVVGITYMTLIYEIYSPVGFFSSKFRPIFVVGGILFHFVIALTMGIYFFGFILAASLLVFVSPDWFRKVMKRPL
ncbi:MAG: HTTM domain-containing protein [Bdellovibrionales bacterium]|nr:HTTM domain-containing protein [Bdellovibrionales bacterium]